MFILVHMRDVIMIPPHRLGWDLTRNLSNQITIKYCNHVLYNVGLVISLFDILKMNDPVILPGHPDVTVTLEFRMVVFRPFVGEVLSGHVLKSTTDGVHVHVDFFHNILIPPECLPQESVFNPSEQVWVWKYKVEEETHDLYMDAGEEIRFKITKEQFVDIAADVNKAGGEMVPYMLYAQVSDAGLGLLSWWN